MADKQQHPQFRSDAERKKWTSLQNRAGHSLSQIAQGKATPADFKNVDKTLANMSKMAKGVFADAVKAAEAQVAVIQKANLKKTKEDQEAFAASVSELLKDQMPELLAQIKDIIEIESMDQDDRFEKTLSSQLEAFSSFLPPRDLPTTDDMVAMHEATIEQQSTSDDRKWESRQKKILTDFTDRVADVVKATILSMAMASVSPAAQAQASPSSAPRLTGPSATWDVVDDEPRPSVARRSMSMLAAPKEEDVTDVHDVGSSLVPTTGFKPSVKDMGSVVNAGATGSTEGSGVNISLSKAAEQAITNAATAQTKLHEQIRDMLQSTTKGGAGAENTEDDTDEAKTADVWWRSFGKWVGDKYDSVKDKISTGMSWLTTLGTGLMSVLLAPKLYETIATKAKELLTWDNIKKAAEESWNYMYDKGKSVLDWVGDKLGLGKVIDKAEGAFNTIADAVGWLASKFGFKSAPSTGTVSKHDSNAGGTTVGGRGKPAPGTKTTVATPSVGSTGQSMVGPSPTPAQQAAASGGESSSAKYFSGVQQKSQATTAASASSVLSPTANTVSNVSSVSQQMGGSNTYGFKTLFGGGGNTPFTSGGSAGTTTSTTGNPVSVTPAVTTPVAGSPSATTTNARSAPQSQSTSTMGINSFGINSGTDDSLALMNLGVISG
jgi:hypothetical protein